MTFNGPIGGLIDFAIGGGWGSEVPKENHSRVAVIRGTDIPKVALGDISTVPFRYESNKKLANRVLAPGDVVLETAGGSSANGQYTGRTLLITQEILDKLGPTICASFCKKLVLKKDLVNPFYFYLYMQDLYKSGRVASYDSQSTGISNFQYEAFVNNELLKLPKFEIQTSVANVLSNLQNKINTNFQISKSLEGIAQTIFKSWFIDFDPVKAKISGHKPVGMDAATAALFPDSMEESELGLIPEGWKVSGLNEFAKPRKELAKVSSLDSQTNYVGLEHLPRNSLFFRTWSSAEKAQSGKSVFNRNDILFGKLRPYFHKVVVSPVRGVCSTDIVVIQSPDSKIDPYTACLVNQDEFITFVTNRSSGTRMPRTSWPEMCEFRIAFPGIDLMQKFNELMEPLFSFAISVCLESNELETIRETLLPRLISGELPIPEEILAS